MIDINKLFKVYSNVIIMLKDRGYKLEKKYKLSFDRFRKKYYDNDHDIYAIHKKTKNKLKVQFSINNKNKLQIIKQNIQDNFNDDTESNFSIILVLNNKPNNIILKFINNSLYKDKIEIFWTDILQINITKHILQPKFELLNENEKNKLLEKFNIKIQQLPKLSTQDPICKYYKFPKYSVVKITRKNKNSINSEYYRYVS